MSDPALGLLMLTLIVVVIMMGFATAFTLMGLGIIFGFIAFYDPTQAWTHNKFFSIQLAFRRVPAALAVATLIVCTFWGIASGLVGAVVVLMGVIAFNPMLRAG